MTAAAQRLVAGARSGRGAAGAIARRLDAINARHPWSHNDHFHSWILRRLPARRTRAVDVGCGRGELAARLAERFDAVLGVDADADMARVSARRFDADPRVTIRHSPFDELTGEYDLVTMISTLHHLELEPALRRCARLVRPGGKLLVVSLAPVTTRRDAVVDVASAVLNPVVGLLRNPRGVAPADRTPPFPVADPTVPFTDVAAAAGRILAGCRARRRLFFRFTLEWTRPPEGP